MKMERLKAAQDAGWIIAEADADTLTVACPRQGCGVRLQLREGDAIPACTTREGPEVFVGSHDQAREFLRSVRERLGLSIGDVEHLAGLATSHLLKAEKDNPARRVELDTLTPWAGSVGYAVALVPVALPSSTLRLISETRHLVPQRQRNARQAQEQRERKRQAQDRVALPPPPPPPGLPMFRAAAAKRA